MNGVEERDPPGGEKNKGKKMFYCFIFKKNKKYSTSHSIDMYGQHPGPTPTFGGRTSNAYGQAPSFGQAAPGSWNTNANTANNDDKLGHKAMKDPLLSTIK